MGIGSEGRVVAVREPVHSNGRVGGDDQAPPFSPSVTQALSDKTRAGPKGPEGRRNAGDLICLTPLRRSEWRPPSEALKATYPQYSHRLPAPLTPPAGMG